MNELSGIVQDKKKGDKIKLEILRDKKPLTFDVEVEEEESGGIFGMAPFGGRAGRPGALRPGYEAEQA